MRVQSRRLRRARYGGVAENGADPRGRSSVGASGAGIAGGENRIVAAVTRDGALPSAASAARGKALVLNAGSQQTEE